MSRHTILTGIVIILLAGATTIEAVDVNDTRLVADPAVSAEHVAFIYAEDLWVVGRDGGQARRLTTHEGREQRPRFSADGSMIAFSAEYDGNMDVYLIGVEGGAPERLTWHPARDLVQGFTEAGDVLFVSNRSSSNWRHSFFFSIPPSGGLATRLPVPFGNKGSMSDDGSTLAYLPLYEAFRQWKNYRGGTASRVWLLNLSDLEVEQVPQPEGRCNDTDPMWVDGTLYFLSDRDGEFNLYRLGEGNTVDRMTNHPVFPILAASAGGGVIVYEQAGWLHLFDPKTATARRLPVGAAADLAETRPRFASGDRWIRNAHVSPSGARAVFEYRGEIVTVPAEHGDPRVLTGTTGAHERSPIWSPDGTSIAYISDAFDDEYSIVIQSHDGRGEPRRLDLAGAGFANNLKWSPDGTRISYVDNSMSIWIVEVASGKAFKVGSEPLYNPARTTHHAWSPDSKWLAYTLNTMTMHNRVFLYDVSNDTSHPVTDGLADATEPVFDSSGRYLFMASSTDAGPVRQWFAQSNSDMERSNALYLAVLAADEPSPIGPRSDEEEPKTNGGKDETEEQPGDDDVLVHVDIDGLGQRIVALPVETALYTDLAPGTDGSLLYLRERPEGRSSDLVRFDLEKREETVLLEKTGGFVTTADGAKVLAQTSGSWLISDSDSKIDAAKGALDIGAIRVRIDPRQEWPQIYNEAWRINRDWFYDPNMHGADWPKMRERYEVFLPHLAVRSDLNRVIRWLCSELAVGHHRVYGGDRRLEPETVPGGLLGADLEISNGRYRFAKVYGGLNWNPDLRSPLTEPGVGVVDGEYLLAVNGLELSPPANPFEPFEQTAGTIVEIEVGPNADGSRSRTVHVVPIEDEMRLRNRAWVESNIEKVDAATDGRVAYVYVPNTAGLGHTYFKRYFFPQADKQGIIIDERFNRGGQVADYYIDLLGRPLISYWHTRYGKDFKTPISSIQGPKAMVIDETAGSGGDMLPWMFSKLEMGPLVGRRTWGGLVGVLGFPPFIDGGGVTAPNLAIWTEEGFIVENVGVPPDYEVEQWPKDIAEGRDPQLEKAIELLLEELEANPPAEPVRPPFPIRARQ